MNSNQFFQLVEKHVNGEADDQEVRLLMAYYDVLSAQNRKTLTDEEVSHLEELIWFRIKNTMSGTAEDRKGKSVIRRFFLPQVAAAVVLLVSVGIMFYLTNGPQGRNPGATFQTTDIQPGGNKATLTFADGKTIALSESQEGIVIGDGVTYQDGSKLIDKSDLEPDRVVYMSISTPKGGTYQIILPDGTKVWLNAGSTLSYPARFADSERIVRLVGEAYFEVKEQPGRYQSSKIPFLVKSGSQTVEVLGTQFNIWAYPGHDKIKTTLVEGQVNVANGSSTIVLSPGEQGLVSGNSINVHTVDVSSAVAWKNGRFSFDGKNFSEIMDELGRWYDFEVQYEGPIPDAEFLGGAFRTDKISSVLRFLESADISYRIERGNKGGHLLVITKGKEGG